MGGFILSEPRIRLRRTSFEDYADRKKAADELLRYAIARHPERSEGSQRFFASLRMTQVEKGDPEGRPFCLHTRINSGAQLFSRKVSEETGGYIVFTIGFNQFAASNWALDFNPVSTNHVYLLWIPAAKGPCGRPQE